jgi:hypothetical protein
MRRCLNGLLIAVLLGCATGCGRLNRRVEDHIEEVGSELTGVDVEVENVRITLRKAAGEITGLTVGNPDGYADPTAFNMERLLLDLGLLASLGEGPVVLDELVIDSPVVHLEFDKQGNSNLEDLARAVQANVEPADDMSAEKEPADPDDPCGPLRISVRELRIQGATLDVRRADGTTQCGALPTIALNEVGGEKGKTPAGLGVTVALAIINQSLRQAVAHRLTNGDLFDGTRVLSVLEQNLDLSGEQRDRLAPFVEELCEALNHSFTSWVEKGFVDAEALRDESAPVLDEILERSREILDGEQVQEMERLLKELDEGAAHVVRSALARRLGELLSLSPEQMQRAAPILWKHFEELGRLTASVLHDSDRSREDFRAGFEAIRTETRREMGRVLSPRQMRALRERMDQLRDEVGMGSG